jgi:predicted RNase H-like HicB family nuclease
MEWYVPDECWIVGPPDPRSRSARGDTSTEALVDIQPAEALCFDDAPVRPPPSRSHWVIEGHHSTGFQRVTTPAITT